VDLPDGEPQREEPPSETAAAGNPANTPPDDTRHFSLWGLLTLLTFAAVVLGLGSHVPKPMFAGILGFATLALMALLSLIRDPPVLWQVGWWILLVIYLIAIGAAAWGSPC
jgi:hypothetical protein